MDRELRRTQSNLRIFGAGVIAFTLWDILKPFLVFLLAPEQNISSGDGGLSATSDATEALILLGLLGGLALLVLTLASRLYIGFSARAEAAGKRRRGVYMVLAFLFFSIQVLLLAATVAIQFLVPDLARENIPELIASGILEITSVVTMGELAFTALKFRRLREQKAG